MNQTSRDLFFAEFAAGAPGYDNVIYSASDRSPYEARDLNLIKVIYNLKWPKAKGRPVPYNLIRQNEHDATDVIESIFRTIDFLERKLSTSVKVFDVRIGCVAVRYEVDVEVDVDDVKSAITHFDAVKLSYEAISISATLHGKSVRGYD